MLSQLISEIRSELESVKKNLDAERARSAAKDKELADVGKTNEAMLKKLADLVKATSSEQNFVTYFHKAMIEWENDKEEQRTRSQDLSVTALQKF